MTRICHSCKQERSVQYYISEWQKRFMIPLPFPYCEGCVKRKGGLTLYKDWVVQTERGCRLAPANNPELS